MRIGGREIATGEPVFVIAEIGVNHDGSPERAMQLVEDAAGAGADAVKAQHFRAGYLLSRAAGLAPYQEEAGERDPVEMLRRLELSIAAMDAVARGARERGMLAIATVFSAELVREAEHVSWDAYKTASPDIINRPLLEALGATGRPIILSTGASRIEEIERAVGWIATECRDLGLLQCVSCYPTPPEDTALGGMLAIRELFGWGAAVGYSDHTQGEDTGAIAAVLGATIIEKHLTYDRDAAGPDHAASLDPEGFARYVANVRRASADPESVREFGFDREAIFDDPRVGPRIKQVLECEEDVRTASRQSIVARRALEKGERIRREDVTCKRPGTGIEPWRMDHVVGETAARSIDADTPIVPGDLE